MSFVEISQGFLPIQESSAFVTHELSVLLILLGALLISAILMIRFVSFKDNKGEPLKTDLAEEKNPFPRYFYFSPCLENPEYIYFIVYDGSNQKYPTSTFMLFNDAISKYPTSQYTWIPCATQPAELTTLPEL